MDRALGGGAHRVEAKERPGRRKNPRAGLLGAIDQIPIVEKLPDAERHEDLAAVDHREANAAEQLRRQAFDNDVAALGQSFSGDNRNAVARSRQIAPRLVMIADRDRDENQTGNALFQPARHIQPDRAQPSDPDVEFIALHWRHLRLVADRLAG